MGAAGECDLDLFLTLDLPLDLDLINCLRLLVDLDPDLDLRLSRDIPVLCRDPPPYGTIRASTSFALALRAEPADCESEPD